MWSIFISAIGLLFVFEGILPFLTPTGWRRLMEHMSMQSDQALRIVGLVSMLTGLGLVCIARNLYW